MESGNNVILQTMKTLINLEFIGPLSRAVATSPVSPVSIGPLFPSLGYKYDLRSDFRAPNFDNFSGGACPQQGADPEIEEWGGHTYSVGLFRRARIK